MMLYQITSKYFCAGLITSQTGYCIKCAPILYKRFYHKYLSFVEEK